MLINFMRSCVLLLLCSLLNLVYFHPSRLADSPLVFHQDDVGDFAASIPPLEVLDHVQSFLLVPSLHSSLSL